MITLADVARRAGVSKSTASRSLRGMSTISVPTRDRVVRAARELDFVVTPCAERLATGRTSTVGVVVPYVTTWFFSQIVSGAERALRRAGYDVILVILSDAATREDFFARMPLRRRVDAVLLLTMPVTPEEVAALGTLGVPLATIGEALHGVSGVGIDDVAVGRTAAEHLLGLGHTDIGLVTGEPDGLLAFSAPLARSRGFHDAVRAAGIEARPDTVVAADFSVAGGAAAMRQLLALARPPTAVFAIGDEMAIGGLHTCTSLGLRVPEDVSVMGVDDHTMSETFALTTVRQPVHAQGELAAQLLVRQLTSAYEAPSQQVVRTELVIRSTTAAPADHRQSRSGTPTPTPTPERGHRS